MKIIYTYDFGDDWCHEIVLEKILPAENKTKYPICIGGKRACPPEDCGGFPGYLEICSGESEFQEEYENYDPKYFNPEDISFENPKKSLKEKLIFSGLKV